MSDEAATESRSPTERAVEKLYELLFDLSATGVPLFRMDSSTVQMVLLTNVAAAIAIAVVTGFYFDLSFDRGLVIACVIGFGLVGCTLHPTSLRLPLFVTALGSWLLRVVLLIALGSYVGGLIHASDLGGIAGGGLGSMLAVRSALATLRRASLRATKTHLG